MYLDLWRIYKNPLGGLASSMTMVCMHRSWAALGSECPYQDRVLVGLMVLTSRLVENTGVFRGLFFFS